LRGSRHGPFDGDRSSEIRIAGVSIALPLGISPAEAGQIIRTTRRQVRRSTYFCSLPQSCVTRTVSGVIYHYCGGVYYQPVTDGTGKTAYIIVTP
jgi:hypothetical protein